MLYRSWSRLKPWLQYLVALHVVVGLAIVACSAAITFSPQYPELWRAFAIVVAAIAFFDLFR